jgi:two-component system nitrogen regulation response regulator NtrX
MEKGNSAICSRAQRIPFYVPPLRERVEDVPVLTEHFIQEFSQLYGRKAKEVSPEALDLLKQYRWPGNVRELKNLVERMVIMTPGSRLEVRHLPSVVLKENGSPEDPSEARSLSEARLAFDRDYILKKLEENGETFLHRRCAWNRTQPPVRSRV